ncbi:37S ribosomal protein, mitochondrial, variant 3 [Orbilia oligospora]|nr:37S ribosomal protein, mitochondrial, variant 3 [Orbilia oligospora]KAF3235979.1 37S ribosomal protein, mitochondrial, variant 3 [Orbilia oligospora]TGJ74523.1 37S ribosomal protein, mitochondrial, variant 2 [Orbilia oligospora]
MIPRRVVARSLQPSSKFLLRIRSAALETSLTSCITELISLYSPCLRQHRSISTETSPGSSNPAAPKGPLIVDFDEQVKLAASEPSRPSIIPQTRPQVSGRPLTKLEEYQRLKASKHASDLIGGVLEDHYKPHELITNPPSPRDITLELLLASGAHLGHATALWNPGNQRFIFGIRQGIHLISLDVIAAHLRRAAKVVHGVSKNGGIIIFVGTRDGQERAVVEAAKRAKGYHVTERWVPGTITNKDQLLSEQKVRILNYLDQEIRLTEEEKLELKQKLAGENGDIHRIQVEDTAQVPFGYGAIRPDLVVCLNPLENKTMLQECAQYRIPTIGIIDTDVDPTCVTYPIPANDDSLRCVQLIVGVLGRAGQEGRLARYEEETNRAEELKRRQKRLEETERTLEEATTTSQVYKDAEQAASESRQRELERESLISNR